MPTRTLVTSALPYANGPIHFGHVAGAYLPADIYVRFLRLRREETLFICGTDEHGTPITVNAEKQGVPPKQFVDQWHEVIGRTFEKLDIRFDNFSQTSLPEHYALSTQFFRNLLARNFIFSDTRAQQHCPRCQRGLPDRFVTGTCYRPECGYTEARGDECPKCGFNLDATKLIDPRCRTCGAPAEVRDSLHWYLDLPKLRERLEPWLAEKQGRWKPNVLGEVKKFLDGLEARAITRDLDWGVPVPLPEGKGKVLYVWFDAPIGYISSTIEWAGRQGKPDAWKEWWLDRDRVRLVHFIGKDNISFHTVIWPGMLLGQPEPYVLPHDVPANEFYNLEGRKFSTSDGWFIDIEEFLGRYPADTLRWTIARGAPETRDSEFTWKDFQAKVNAELLGNFGNLASRLLKFVQERFDGRIPAAQAAQGAPEQEAVAKALQAFAALGQDLERYGVRAGAERLLEIGDAGNKLIEQREPWKTAKSAPDLCATALNTTARILELLAVGLTPYCPNLAGRLWTQLGLAGSPHDRGWQAAPALPDPGQRPIGALEHLMKRIDDSEVKKGVGALESRAASISEEKAGKAGGAPAPGTPPSVPAATAAPTHPPGSPAAAVPASPGPAAPAIPASSAPAAPATAPAPAHAAATGPKPEVSYDEFAKLELVAARVISASVVKGADRLYQLELEVDGGARRTVLSGIRPWYTIEQLVGRSVVYFANLAPKKIRGVMSHGMILAAHGADGAAVLLKPEGDVPPGSKVS